MRYHCYWEDIYKKDRNKKCRNIKTLKEKNIASAINAASAHNIHV
jgi:hypothetical protein